MLNRSVSARASEMDRVFGSAASLRALSEEEIECVSGGDIYNYTYYPSGDVYVQHIFINENGDVEIEYYWLRAMHVSPNG